MAEDLTIWAERSRAIAKEHCSMKRAAIKEYRKAGLFSIKNFRAYYRIAINLDKVYFRAHAEEWERLVKAEQKSIVEQQFHSLKAQELASETA